jgi:hypothetical protein
MNLSINSFVKQHGLQSLTKSSPALHAVSWQVDTRTSVSHSFHFWTRSWASHRCHCAMWRSGLNIVCLSCCSGQAESRQHLRNSRDWEQQPVVSSAPQIMNWAAEVHKDWATQLQPMSASRAHYNWVKYDKWQKKRCQMVRYGNDINECR